MRIMGKMVVTKYNKHNIKIALNLSETQLSALFLVLNESQSYSTLPYKSEINAIINNV